MIKRRFTSVLVVSGLSPLFVWVWREFTGLRVSVLTTGRVSPPQNGGLEDAPVWLPPLSVCVCVCVFQSTPTLLALMGLRCEGLVPAIVLPLLLTMVTLTYTQNPSATPGATGGTGSDPFSSSQWNIC